MLCSKKFFTVNSTLYIMHHLFSLNLGVIFLVATCFGLEIQNPNDTSVWTIGQDQVIQWSSDQSLCTFRLKISLKRDINLGVDNPTIFVFANALCINQEYFQFRLPLRTDLGVLIETGDNYFISIDASNSSFFAVSQHFVIIIESSTISSSSNITQSTQEPQVQSCVINDAKWSSVCSGDWTFGHSGIKRIELQITRCTSPQKVSMFVTYVWDPPHPQALTISAPLINGDIAVYTMGEFGIFLIISKVNVHDTYVMFDISTKVNTVTNGVSTMHIGQQKFGSPDYSVCQLPFATLCQAELDRCKPSVWYTSAVISAALFVLFVIISTSVAVAVICCCCDDRRKYARFNEITRKKVKKLLKAKEFSNKRSPSKDALIMMEQRKEVTENV